MPRIDCMHDVVRSRGGGRRTYNSTLRLRWVPPRGLAAGSVFSEVTPSGPTLHDWVIGMVGPELAAVGLSVTTGRHGSCLGSSTDNLRLRVEETWPLRLAGSEAVLLGAKMALRSSMAL